MGVVIEHEFEVDDSGDTITEFHVLGLTMIVASTIMTIFIKNI